MIVFVDESIEKSIMEVRDLEARGFKFRVYKLSNGEFPRVMAFSNNEGLSIEVDYWAFAQVFEENRHIYSDNLLNSFVRF